MALLITPPFIATFVHVWKPRPNKNPEKAKYEVAALFTEPSLDTPEWKAMVAAVTEAGREKFGADKFNKDFIEKLRAKDRFCIRDAGEKSGEYKGYEPGRKFINMKRQAADGRPEIVDLNYSDILDESLFYPGVIARAGVNFFAYDNEYGQGVSCFFEHLQLIKTGTPRMDNRVSAKKMFEGAGDTSDMADAVLKDRGIDSQSADENNGEDLGV